MFVGRSYGDFPDPATGASHPFILPAQFSVNILDLFFFNSNASGELRETSPGLENDGLLNLQ